MHSKNTLSTKWLLRLHLRRIPAPWGGLALSVFLERVVWGHCMCSSCLMAQRFDLRPALNTYKNNGTGFISAVKTALINITCSSMQPHWALVIWELLVSVVKACNLVPARLNTSISHNEVQPLALMTACSCSTAHWAFERQWLRGPLCFLIDEFLWFHKFICLWFLFINFLITLIMLVRFQHFWHWWKRPETFHFKGFPLQWKHCF